MTSGPPLISLVICTRDRGSVLEECLRFSAATDLDADAWELIVVDNGSTDHTSTIIRTFAEQAPFAVKTAYEPVKGLGRARNAGVRIASGALVAFTDDDCRIAPDFLRRTVDAFESSGYGYIGGRVLLHDPADAPITIKKDTRAEEVPACSCLTPGFIHGANMAVRREIWAEVGGFDPLFGVGQRFACEDIDFLTRVSWAGWKGAYVPGPTVHHNHGRKPGPAAHRLAVTYARARGAYYAKCCLSPSLRRISMRQWYWDLRRDARNGRLSQALWGIAGGAEYLVRHLLPAAGGCPSSG